MAIYHLEAKVITRGVGRSVVAAAAYASCSEIYNDYDGVTHDYTQKHGLVHSEVILPPNAPTEWQERAVLWNAVEAAEKTKDSRLARELIVALPVELEKSEWIEMLRAYIMENCVSKGMCADFSIHDTDGHNPHAHILLTVRPLNDKGKWQPKTQKEYICKLGNEERGFTADEFKAAQTDGWEKQYQYFVGKKKVYMTQSEATAQGYERVSKNPKSTLYGRQNPICAEWNSEEQIVEWRKAWENAVNKSLEQKNILDCVDCRSFSERGIDEQPTIHEGVYARVIEQRGGVSERCELNRQIKKDNMILRQIKEEIKRLSDLIENTVSKIAAKLEGLWSKIVTANYIITYNERNKMQMEVTNGLAKTRLKEYKLVVKKIKAKTVERLRLQSEKDKLNPLQIIQKNILTKQIATLTEDISELNFKRKSLLSDMYCDSDSQVKEIENLIQNNNETIDKITVHNAKLTANKEADKSEYEQIKTSITPEYTEAVQSERENIRDDSESRIRKRLQDSYGNKYDSKIYDEAVTATNKELSEKPIQKKSIRKILNRQHTQPDHKRKKDGLEL